MTADHLTEGIFVLPGGLILDDGRRLSDAELRPLSGHEEDWLAHHVTAPSALVVTYVLTACLERLGDGTPNRELIRRLLVGDRDYLMLQLRRITLGERVSSVITCPSCSARMDVDFRIEDVPIERRPQAAEVYSLEIDVGRPRSLRVRLPTGGDQEAVLGMNAESAVNCLLDRCIVESDGPLSADDRAAVVDAIEQLAPRVDLDLELTCPECLHEFVEEFDTTAFFLDEVRQGGGQLLREVHALAFHYHWSEADILRLTRTRRRAYLALLSDALRPG